MHDFKLTQKEEIKLRIAHRKRKDKRSADRIKSLILLGTGWTYKKVSEALLLDEETLRKHTKVYRSVGLDAVLKDKHTGSYSKLSESEIVSLCAHIEDNLYATVEEIICYVQKAYQVSYSVSGMTDLLHRKGFVYKKAKIIPGKSDVKKQQAFVKSYKELKAQKAESDPIYFCDGVHPTHNTESLYCWIKKGKEKELRSNTGRQRLNINGAIDIETKEVLCRYDDTLNAQSTVKLLKEVVEKHPLSSKIYMIVDNARYYKCKVVSKYLETSKIEMIFLPTYSPNLNLIERLWKFFRKKVTKGKYYEKFTEFKAECERFFKNLKQHKPELDSLLIEKFQIIGLAKTPNFHS